jgi:hypothetical protein
VQVAHPRLRATQTSLADNLSGWSFLKDNAFSASVSALKAFF